LWPRDLECLAALLSWQIMKSVKGGPLSQAKASWSSRPAFGQPFRLAGNQLWQLFQFVRVCVCVGVRVAGAFAFLAFE